MMGHSRVMVVQNAPQHSSRSPTIAQLERQCGGICEDLLDLPTKSNTKQKASRLVATFANS